MAASTHPNQGSSEIEYVPQESVRKGFLEQEDGEDRDIFFLHFTVTDTGCGLSPEHKAKLFTRFTQATPKTHVQYGGSGLGLFISRELAEMQGGAVGVQSVQGVGSMFSFYIKSRRALPPRSNSNDVTSRSEADFNANPQPHVPQPSELHLIVVEDNLINPRVLCNQLKKLGCTVQVAGHGLEALEQLQKTRYWNSPTVTPPLELSVVLMDVEMPIMNGLECTRRIRELEVLGDIVGHVPIIDVSANARREQMEQAMSAGMNDAISKPFRIPELIPKIQALIMNAS